MPTADTAYSRLEERFRRIYALEQATGVLDWDIALPRLLEAWKVESAEG